MVEKIKKIMIILLLLIIGTNDVKALWIYGYNEGNSYPIDLPDCLINMDGCGGMSGNFVVRVTVVDSNNVRVGDDMTTSVVLHPHNPSDGDFGYFNDDSYGAYNHDYLSDNVDGHDNVWAGYWDTQMSPYSQQDYMLVASNIAWNSYGRNEERSDLYFGLTPGYEIFMGAFFENDDFETHGSFREYFIDNLKEGNKLIYIGEIDKSISIMDFIFKVTGTNAYLGHPDEWRASYNEDIRNEIYGKGYKLLIEPVYTMFMDYNGLHHQVRGTSKQIAQVLSHSKDTDFWYWPMYNPTYMYNLACSLRTDGDASLCNDQMNFDVVSKRAKELKDAYNDCNRQKGPGKDACFATRVAQATLNYNSKVDQMTRVRSIYEKIANPDSAYGVNILYIDDYFGGDTPPTTIKEYRTNKCEFNISSCENNGFTLSSRLNSSTGDIFDCIYPSDTNKIDRNELKQYSVQYENADLWCYDNTTYSFESLREDMFNTLNKNPIVTNQLLAIPHGTLTVERTCFSKSNNIPTGDISAVFESDDANYQNEFKLFLNNKEYTYKRGQKYQGSKDKTGGFSYNSKEAQSTYGENYYEYTSTFNYDYELVEGVDALKSNINILNYNISSALGSSNGIDYSTNGKTIYAKVVTAEKMKDQEYTNSLYTNKTGKELRITNGFGYGNKLFEALDAYSSNQVDNTNTLERKGERQAWYDDDQYNFTNTYTMEEKVNKQCTFKTKGTGINIWDEIKFRTISLSNPFPGRDGTSRMPGTNWITETNNYVYDYIQNNRNVKADEVYKKEPLYTVTLDASSMIKIREYNKTHSYTYNTVSCESGTGRRCISDFLRNEKYIKNLKGTCSSKNVDFYTCADKSFTSGG